MSTSQKISPLKTFIYTLFALVAFAANSVLCRLALGEHTIDAASFTAVRLLSGVVILLLILKLSARKEKVSAKGSWVSALMLFLYAIAFSFAYVSLDTGTGALVLFSAVQITIILISLFSGNRPHITEWVGMLVAFGGFVYLVLPGVTTPSFLGFCLMTVAGVAWGIYTLRGKSSAFPLGDTAFNFARTIPLVIILALVATQILQVSPQGVFLAILSGAVASGIGYTVWYIALGGLSATEAAVVQLSVPVIAATGGVVFVAEIITQRLVYAAVLILGGILMVVLGRYYFPRSGVIRG